MAPVFGTAVFLYGGPVFLSGGWAEARRRRPGMMLLISMGLLVGDTTANGVVNACDVSQTKSQVGQAVTMSNFREDVNASGTITATDVAQVKAEVGTALPPSR